MKEKLKTILSLIIIIICLPYLVTFIVQGDFLNEPQQEKTDEKQQEENTERLILTAANEMPVTYEKEALKAQTVIARTNLAYAAEHEQAEPESISREDLRSRLGAQDFNKYYELLKSCAEETAGEVAVYKKQIVQLPYHYVSAGRTRNAPKTDDTDDKESMPYVKSVSSTYDLRSEKFLEIEFLSMEQFRNKLAAAYPKLKFPENDIEKMISVLERDEASYVVSVQLPGEKASGEEIRRALSLHSACFSIKKVDEKVRIVTKGYGHGYGMSQYGANEMAGEGSSYEDILKYYYSGITIENYQDKENQDEASE